jgi:N-acetylglucosaminyldiphosphoundecaprenol N-acetyl-beta-D-mannosaminyltransferase
MNKPLDKPESGSYHGILGMNVAVTTLPQAVERVMQLSCMRKGSYVCAANVHMCMEAYRDKAFQAVVNNAALVVPDGKPLMWWMWSFGASEAKQVRGPDLFSAVCEHASENGIPVALYGASPGTLERLQKYMIGKYPGIDISCAISPPFRLLSEEEQQDFLDSIGASGARILFVGLGCPKQENWMANNAPKLDLVMLGVGAAFDFYSGDKKVAPEWMRKAGLEWLHRLLSEPGRLWKRYLLNNPYFIYLYVKSLIGNCWGAIRFRH